MATILSQLDPIFRAAIRAACGVDADPALAVSQNDKFGDYQSNAAMGLAKQLKSNPRQVAEQIKGKLELGEIASEMTIAGPGFINVRLNPDWLAKQTQSHRHRRPAGHPACAFAANSGHRLFRPERRKGTACRAHPQHHHRRRHRANHRIPWPPRHPPKSPRRLGNAVRHADLPFAKHAPFAKPRTSRISTASIKKHASDSTPNRALPTSHVQPS